MRSELCPSWSNVRTPRLRIAIFRGYFDEGGHPADAAARAFSFGGCIARLGTWPAFDTVWNSVLELEDVRDATGRRWFHMKDFAHFRGAFTGWTEERRRSLLAGLVRTIIEHDLMCVGVAWQFDPTTHRHGLDYYYNAAYRACILYAENFASGEEVEFVFAQHAEISAVAYEQLHRRVREAYTPARDLGDLAYGDPRSLPALQAADLIAYELRAHASNLQRLRWPLAQLPRERCRFELLS